MSNNDKKITGNFLYVLMVSVFHFVMPYSVMKILKAAFL